MVHRVICRCELIKKIRKNFDPLCNNSENGAKLTISTKYAVEKRHGGHSTGGIGFARSPVVLQQGPIAVMHWPVV